MNEFDFEELRNKPIKELRAMLKETTDLDQREDIEAAIFMKRMKRVGG